MALLRLSAGLFALVLLRASTDGVRAAHKEHETPVYDRNVRSLENSTDKSIATDEKVSTTEVYLADAYTSVFTDGGVNAAYEEDKTPTYDQDTRSLEKNTDKFITTEQEVGTTNDYFVSINTSTLATVKELPYACSPQFENLTITQDVAHSKRVDVAWKPVNDSKICAYQYVVRKKDTRTNKTAVKRTNSSSVVNFDDVQPCTIYNITVEVSPIDRPELILYTASQSVDFDDYAVPGKVINLNIETMENESSLVTWIPPNNSQCISKYRVSSKNFKEITNGTSLQVNQRLDCVEITVTAISRLGKEGSAERILKPPRVKNPVVTYPILPYPKDDSVMVTWERTSNDDCVKSYSVALDNTSVDVGKNLSFTFNNVIPCIEYEIQINSVSDTEHRSEVIFRNISVQDVQPVENITNVIEANNCRFNWDSPPNPQSCSLNYTLKLYRDDSLIKETTTNDRYWFLRNLDYCVTYRIEIVASFQKLFSPSVGRNFTILSESRAPKCSIKPLKATEAVMECEAQNSSLYLCSIDEITVECKSTEGDSNYRKSKKIGNEGFPTEIILDRLREYTNYSCLWNASSVYGNASSVNPVIFNTHQGVPDAPILKPISTYITSNTFLITWNKVKNVRGILQNFTLIVEAVRPTYFVPKECKERNKKYNYIVRPNETEFLFSYAFPSYRYNVSIFASTEVGISPSSIPVEVVTASGIPEGIRNTNLINQDKIIEIGNFNESISLVWTYPCYTNGNISYFQIDIIGKSYVDHVEDHIITSRKDVNKPLSDLQYNFRIENLKPAFVYEVSLKVVNQDNSQSEPEKIKFNSSEGYPDAPILKEVQAINNTLKIDWEEPKHKNGVLINYTVTVQRRGELYWVPPECRNFKDKDAQYHVLPNFKSHNVIDLLPYNKYVVFVSASTKERSSVSSNEIESNTLEAKPEEVRDLSITTLNNENGECNNQAELKFSYPCNTFGRFKQIVVRLFGVGPENITNETILIETNNESQYHHPLVQLWNETTYEVAIWVETEKFKSNGIAKTFKTSSGVPPKPKTISTPLQQDSTKAKFTLSKDLFANTNGKVLYYSLIIGEKGNEEKSTLGCWNETWPSIEKVLSPEERLMPYQATPNLWNPFEDNQTHYTIILGDNSTYQTNKPLKAGLIYTLKVRGLTEHGYRDSETVVFELKSESQLGITLGVIFGLLGALAVIVFVYLIFRRRQNWYLFGIFKNCQKDDGQSFRTKVKESIKPLPLIPIPIPVSKFSQYYNELKNNSEKLKQEFALLGTKSGEIALTCNDALLPENKKKNRYTNILPYDVSRVKLSDHDGSEIGGDYINASYVKGYLGTFEYIAAQGPLEHTCVDFWKMILQENSSLIVMVAQFIETNKEKCYKYFPNIHENMELENGIAIRCCTELNFKTHIVRTFLVQKDMQQWTITHLQFIDWPDFGCPKGIDVILEFCQLMREHAERNSDPIIIHCSAGVGRTGTLIALDILLQIKNNKQDINIFDTVLNLRHCRKNMVQTEKQYLFIHNCVDSAIHNPTSLNYVISKDHTYENLDEIKKANGGSLENCTQESKF